MLPYKIVIHYLYSEVMDNLDDRIVVTGASHQNHIIELET